MGDSWHCLVFGEELGPMSWDDLVSLAARGALGKREKVRSSRDAEWVIAESIEGLFPVKPVADPRESRPWFCEAWGSELGPFSWTELCDMARRGALTRTQRVRQAGESAWRAAQDVADLFPEPAPSETDFEVDSQPAQDATAHAAAVEADFDVAPSVARIEDEQADFDVTTQVESPLEEPQEATNEAVAEEEVAEIGAPVTADAHAAAPANTGPKNPAPLASASLNPAPPDTTPQKNTVQSVASSAAVTPPEKTDAKQGKLLGKLWKKEPSKAPAAPPKPKPDSPKKPPREARQTSPKKKTSPKPPPKKKPATRASSSAGMSEETKKALRGLAGIACIAGFGYLGYLGFNSMPRWRSVNYDQVLAGYDQLHEEAKKAQSDPSLLANPQTGIQFVSTLSKLREALKDAPPDTVDYEIYQTGGLLTQMLSTAAAKPGSEQAATREQAEADFATKMAEIRGKLGR